MNLINLHKNLLIKKNKPQHSQNKPKLDLQLVVEFDEHPKSKLDNLQLNFRS